MKESARRHYRAASELHAIAGPGSQPGCRAVAGYLYGIAGELALKELMREAGLRPLSANERRNDPFFAHFPDLQTMLNDHASGRRAGRAVPLLTAKRLFSGWNTNMRYAPTSDVSRQRISDWQEDARKLLDIVGTL